ncbi:MAG: AraC family transcriptional regulator [Fibrobacteres bacterium]|nr:AraC family transcriptional regulator [Fibrobacterota bacterium]
MSFINLTLHKTPRIQAADYGHYKTGVEHPDRILNVHDIVYIVDGNWEIWEGDTPYLLEKGDVIFLYSGRRHFGKRVCESGTKTRYIHFYPEEQDHYSAKPISTSNDGIAVATHTKCGNDENIRRLFEEVIHLHWSSIKENRILARIKLEELLISLAKTGGSTEKRRAGSVDYVISIIEQAPHKNFEIDELADKIQVSRRNLTSMFKSKTGLSIKQFQLNLKINRAASIIANSPFVSFKEVAEQFNFYDEFHFSKLFKQKTGHYPSSFRQKQLESAVLNNAKSESE